MCVCVLNDAWQNAPSPSFHCCCCWMLCWWRHCFRLATLILFLFLRLLLFARSSFSRFCRRRSFLLFHRRRHHHHPHISHPLSLSLSLSLSVSLSRALASTTPHRPLPNSICAASELRGKEGRVGSDRESGSKRPLSFKCVLHLQASWKSEKKKRITWTRFHSSAID